jgi:hypothetical protein
MNLSDLSKNMIFNQIARIIFVIKTIRQQVVST